MLFLAPFFLKFCPLLFFSSYTNKSFKQVINLSLEVDYARCSEIWLAIAVTRDVITVAQLLPTKIKKAAMCLALRQNLKLLLLDLYLRTLFRQSRLSHVKLMASIAEESDCMVFKNWYDLSQKKPAMQNWNSVKNIVVYTEVKNAGKFFYCCSERLLKTQIAYIHLQRSDDTTSQ